MAEFGTTRDTVDVIRTLVSELTPTVVIEDAIDNLDGTYTLSIFKTYWLRPQKEIVIDSSVYKIVSFVMNESITIQDINSAGIPTVQDFKLPAPNFYHGTTIMAASEQSKHKDPKLKTPFVWLYERLEETEITDPLNKWGRESEPRLFFMDEARYADWTSTQHKTGAIDPIRQMVELMFFNIENQRGLYGRVNEYKTTNIANWGKFNTDKGNADRFFAQDLSGILCNFKLIMSKTACDNRNSIGPSECTIAVTVETTPSTGSNGTATAIVTGGQGDISFLWSDGQTANPAINLPAGPISVTVTDDFVENCTSNADGVVESGGTGFGNYLLFDGVNDYGTLNGITINDSTTYTLGGWFYVADFNSRNYIMSSLSKDRFWRFTNATTFRSRPAGTTSLDFSFSALSVDTWYYIVCSADGTNTRLYANNTLLGTKGVTTGSKSPINLVGMNRTFGGLYDGGMDGLWFINDYGATAQDVEDLYNGGNYKDPLEVISGLDILLPFNESGTDTLAVDSTVNGNDMTLVNFASSGMWQPR